LPVPDRPSIAVLPFSNMSGDPEQEYFADGIVEDITTALSRVKGMFVIARSSSFVFKGRAVDIRQVGEQLGVRYILEGSVRRSKDRVRITGQLVDTTSGHHIGADHVDGSLEDLFDLQDKVTETGVAAVQPNIRTAEIERARLKPTGNLDAYDHYLRALPHHYSMTREGLETAQLLLSEAIRLDPEYALAKAFSAFNAMHQLSQGWAGEGT